MHADGLRHPVNHTRGRVLATTLRSTLTALSANSVGGWQALTTALTVAAGPNSSLQFGQRLQVLIAR